MPESHLRYTLDPGRPVREEVIRILRDLSGQGKALIQGPAGEAQVHEARLLIKRSRALLWFARPALGKKAHELARERLRKSAGLLAGPRDLAAALSTLEKLKQETTNASDRKAVTHIHRGQKEAEKAAALAPEAQAKAFGSALRILRATMAEAVSRSRTRSRWPVAMARRKKAFKVLHKSACRARCTKSAADFHAWRKKAKRLFYILELTQEDTLRLGKRVTGCVGKLQSQLGDYHDQGLAEGHLARKRPRPSSARRVLALLAKSRRRLRKKVWELQRRIELT